MNDNSLVITDAFHTTAAFNTQKKPAAFNAYFNHLVQIRKRRR